MWKQILDPPGLEWYEVSHDGQVRDIETKTPINQYLSHEYWDVSLRNTNKRKHKTIGYKVHRLVAAQFIGPIPKGYVVHHVDFTKVNNHYTNLLICSRTVHSMIHAEHDNSIFISGPRRAKVVPSTPADHGVTVLTEDIVHDICKLLMDGLTFSDIRDKLGLYGITDDCIGKIAQGKNWRHIRNQYDIQATTRDCMNSFSKYKVHIAVMRHNGMSTAEIADAIGFKITNMKERNRLDKCIHRYHQWLINGRWSFDWIEQPHK